jgi:hypothetical protein
MRIEWAKIYAWRDSMGQRLLSLQKRLSTHFRNLSTVVAANVFRTCAFHRLARSTGLLTPPPPPPASIPSKSQVINPSLYLRWHSWYGDSVQLLHSYYTRLFV